MKNKSILFSLFFITFLSLLVWLPNLVLAADSPFAGGDGSIESPYQISTCEQLQNINYYDEANSEYPYLSEGYSFYLNNDIDCSDTLNWNTGYGFIPIGTANDHFRGSFNGNNKIVSDLYINLPETDNVGLFGYVSLIDLNNHEISNVGLVNVDITGQNNVGGLVGYSESIFIHDTYTTGDINGISAGGIIGRSINSSGGGRQCPIFCNSIITDSYSSVNVTGTGNIGGLIGINTRTTVQNSFSVGTVINTSLGKIPAYGGFIGVFSTNIIGETYANFIFNSGWYKSPDGLAVKGIGTESTEVLNYTEIDNTVFYSKNHGVYAQEGQQEEERNVWSFGGNPWYEYTDKYPQFTQQEEVTPPTPHTHHTSSGYASPAMLTQFQAEQDARARAAGLPTNNPDKDCSGQEQYSGTTGQLCTNFSTTPTRILKLGMQGDDVKALQEYLNTHGYDCGIADGNFGLKTKQAVIKFQLASDLMGDGVVGRETMKHYITIPHN